MLQLRSRVGEQSRYSSRFHSRIAIAALLSLTREAALQFLDLRGAQVVGAPHRLPDFPGIRMLLVDSFGVHASRTPGALEPNIYPLLANRVPRHGVVGKHHGSCRLAAHQPGVDGFVMALHVKNFRA